MNKRQNKKRNKIINERIEFLNKHLNVHYGRQCGKTLMYMEFLKYINRIINDKEYKLFKKIKQRIK